MPDDLLFVESVTAAGHRLRVDFFKLADRYGHRLSVVLRDDAGNETVVPMAESVEGTSDDPWPPSPPLQSLSIERLSDRCTAALLVGMAGRSHWSASIEAKRDESTKGILEFDVACRPGEMPRSVSSEYRGLPGVEVIWDAKSSLLLLRSGGIVVVFGSRGFFRNPPVVLEKVEQRFRLAIPLDPVQSVKTVRWQYAVWLGRIDCDR